jgi:excisionase family DNA binding protein
MALLSATQAAKAVGKSVPTITRAIKSGKLSARRLDGGGYEIDTSELFRVWRAVTDSNSATPPMLERETPIVDNVLRVKLEVMDERLSDAQATIKDLRDRLDAESAERRNLTAQITDQRQNILEPRKLGLWARLTGQGA